MPTLAIENLHTYLDLGQPEPGRAVNGVSLALEHGRTHALVGESGCGKSLTALSILRLLPAKARIVGGRICHNGQDLLTLSQSALRKLRGDRIAMIFQEPMTSLNPVLRIGAQLAEPLHLHRRLGRGAAQQRAMTLLTQVGIPDAARCAAAYPHELSGGMRQRVMIAMALACEPDVLIADEPTTALDVTTQAQILKLLRELQSRNGMAILLITHDLAVVAQVADDVSVMYAGRIVETAPTRRLFTEAAHPYTRGLLRSTPRLDSRPARASGARLAVIAGEPPPLGQRGRGCQFEPRCELGGGDPQCRGQVPPLRPCAVDAAVACWKVSSE